MTYYRNRRTVQEKQRLTTDLIHRLKNDESEAIIELLDIFEQKIRWFATESFWDPYHGEVRVVNSDYADILSERLVKAFRKIRLPGGGYGQQEKGKSWKKGRRKL